MTRRGLIAAAALAGLGALTLWAASDLAPFGTPSGDPDAVVRELVRERHVANTVTGVTFDLRGLDTLGEELILFVAALGAAVLLRAERGEEDAERATEVEERRAPGTADAVRATGAVLVGPVLLLGIYIVVHGALTPGG